MNKDVTYAAFGEMALDLLYDEDPSQPTIVDGGVSAYNTIYYLGCLGNDCVALGGVGYDKPGVVLTGAKEVSNVQSAIYHKDGQHYYQAEKAMRSLEAVGVNCTYMQYISKYINVFYIDKSERGVNIGRVDPNSGKSTIEWSNQIVPKLPNKLNSNKLAVVVSNFEPSTTIFLHSLRRLSSLRGTNGKGRTFPIVSMDITNENIFKKYPYDYLADFLLYVDLVQCNEHTLKLLVNKCNQETGKTMSDENFISQTGAKVFTVTRGKNGATFYYLDSQNHYQSIDMRPRYVIKDEIDPTGAGDAFHAVLLQSYIENLQQGKDIDDGYFRRTFDRANALSRKVVGKLGARIPIEDVKKAMELYEYSIS